MAELAYDRIEGARAEKAIAFLHGILGSGGNLRTIARRFVEARPEFAAWLVDLRGHGRSPKRTLGASLAAAADDVRALAARASHPLCAIAGHSFGGKVGLAAARDLPRLDHVFAIDSTPGAREPLSGGDSALAVIETIESLPATFSSKGAFVDAIVAAGQSRALAQWLALSVEPTGKGMRFALDTREIRTLLLDYFATDLWPVVESPPGQLNVHLVVGDRSTSLSAADRDRALAIAATNTRVTVDVLPAGHWVHVDDPEGLLRVLLDRTS